MNGSFTVAFSTRVVFGPHAIARLSEEVDRIGSRRVLFVTTERGRELAERVGNDLPSDLFVDYFSRATMHVPVEVAAAASERAHGEGIDLVIAIGGGSSIGLAKILARDVGLPYIAVPTTYAGSEMTDVWGLTRAGRKETGRDDVVRPRATVYDPHLTVDLPLATSVTSSFNAVAHAIEALTAPDANPVSTWAAQEGSRALLGALRSLPSAPQDVDTRSGMLYGAWLCGTALGMVTMGLHHKICHVLGGSAGLSHAEMHTVVLPYVVAFNHSHAPGIPIALQPVLGGAEVAGGLQALAAELGAPRTLAELGLEPRHVPPLAETIAAARPTNPRPYTATDIEMILREALVGSPAGELEHRLSHRGAPG